MAFHRAEWNEVAISLFRKQFMDIEQRVALGRGNGGVL